MPQRPAGAAIGPRGLRDLPFGKPGTVHNWSVPPGNIILYKYYPLERVDVLERRVIYFSHPSAFNDPFEMQPYFQSTTFAAILRVDTAGEVVDTSA